MTRHPWRTRRHCRTHHGREHVRLPPTDRAVHEQVGGTHRLVRRRLGEAESVAYLRVHAGESAEERLESSAAHVGEGWDLIRAGQRESIDRLHGAWERERQLAKELRAAVVVVHRQGVNRRPDGLSGGDDGLERFQVRRMRRCTCMCGSECSRCARARGRERERSHELSALNRKCRRAIRGMDQDSAPRPPPSDRAASHTDLRERGREGG